MRRKIWTASDVTPGAPKGRETEIFDREVSNPSGGLGGGGEGLDGRRPAPDKVHSAGDATGT